MVGTEDRVGGGLEGGDSFSGILDYMSDVMDGDYGSEFMSYEPWDPKEGAGDPELPTLGFQGAFHLSVKPFRYLTAGNRIGKTLSAAIEAIIMMTGEIPLSMRYDKGVNTGVARVWDLKSPVGKLNRVRWGFRDPATGRWRAPQNDPGMADPGAEARPKEAPCGWVTGVGKYPLEKISRREFDSVWICTWKAVRDERWIKLVSGLLPDQYLDRRWRQDGYSEKAHRFRLSNGNEIVFVTYEMGPERAQGANVWGLFLDEEPKSRDFFTECDQRLMEAAFEGYMALLYTPLLGASWAYLDIYQPLVAGKTPHIEMFHATQYDSPYLGRDAVDRRKARYKTWEVKARVYGKPGVVRGQPYFDYDKLVGTEQSGNRGWLTTFSPAGREVVVARSDAGVSLAELGVEDFGDGWVMLESDRVRGESYFISADTGEGAIDGRDEGDKNVAYVFRLNHQGKDEWPTLVAELSTQQPTLVFAEMVRNAAEYFWNAVIVPEVTGKTGGILTGALTDYPYAFRCTVLNDKTKKLRAKWGFEMTARTRPLVWALVKEYIDDHDSPNSMRFWELLKECSEAIYDKMGKPDHPPHGTSDCITAFGIGLYAHRYGWHQLNVDRSGEVSRKRTRADEYMDNLKKRYGTKETADPALQPLGSVQRGSVGGSRGRASSNRPSYSFIT